MSASLLVTKKGTKMTKVILSDDRHHREYDDVHNNPKDQGDHRHQDYIKTDRINYYSDINKSDIISNISISAFLGDIDESDILSEMM